MPYHNLYFKSISLAILLFVGIDALQSQCNADFTFSNQGLNYQFNDISQLAAGDTLSSRTWLFGDGDTDSLSTVFHSFPFPSMYDVTLIIGTTQGCRDTIVQNVTNCNLSLELTVSNSCNGLNNNVLLQVHDLFGVVDSVDVEIDGVAVNEEGYDISSGNLNLNIPVIGDDGLHVVTVRSEYSEECTENFTILSNNCSNECSIQNLSIRANQVHTIDVRDTIFFPENRILTLGDTVNFRWTSAANSSTSDDTTASETWDSGVQFLGATYQVIPQTIGLKPYYSIPRGGPGGEGMSGTLFVNCPSAGTKTINITFENNTNHPGTFYIALDDVLYTDSIYDYNLSGVTMVDFEFPADGLVHKVSIRDVDNPSCNSSLTVSVPECEGILACNLNVSSYQIERCNLDGMVTIRTDISAVGYSNEGISILLDGAFTLDTLMLDQNGKASHIMTLSGDGINHRITVRDIGKISCSEETMVLATDCDALCDLSSLQLSVGDIGTPTFVISDLGIVNDRLLVPSDQGVLFDWVSDRHYGIRSTSGTLSWDSGNLQMGDVFITPILEIGEVTYEIYDDNNLVISNGILEAVARCENGFESVFVRFNDINGVNEGFRVTLDGVEIDGSPFPYSYNGPNYFVFTMLGDDALHSLVIDDLSSEECTLSRDFIAPVCGEVDCEISLTVMTGDTCFNDNTLPYVITISNPTPFPQGYMLTSNGATIGQSTMSYTGNTTVVNDVLLADGSTYQLIVTDVLNDECSDTLSYTPDTCVTDCSLYNMELRIIDEAYFEEFPNTPEVFVGCQGDTTHFVAISFDEKYSDGTEYSIIINSVFYTTAQYNAGDGSNLAFVPVFGDSLFHGISLVDVSNPECTISRIIRTPKCFTECKIFIEDYSISDCDEATAELIIRLNRNIEEDEINFMENGVNGGFITSSDSIISLITGDGLLHQYIIQEADNLLCRDTIDTVSPYCLTCDIKYTLTVLDSCTLGDTISYHMDISEHSENMIEISVDGITQTITKGGTNIFTILSDGTPTTIFINSIKDPFCKDTIIIQTVDCSPIICDAAFTFVQNGLSVVFTDSSTTSSPILSQSWSIVGGATVMNTSTFTFNFAEAGLYTVCHSIETIECENTVCTEINLDPCFGLVSLFSHENVDGGVQFTNQSQGLYDTLSYTFGDGMTSNEEDPLHTYALTGVYTVCLTVRNTDADCSEVYCEDIDFVTATIDTYIDNEVISIYPNPMGGARKLNIESTLSIRGYAIYTTEGKLLEEADIMDGVHKVGIAIHHRTTEGLLLIQIKTDKGVVTRKLVF